jgi:hypothetical protein
MADTLTPKRWGRKESADWWSAGQAARQQNYGAATEMMLDMAGVQAGSHVLDVAAGTGDSALMAAARFGPKGGERSKKSTGGVIFEMCLFAVFRYSDGSLRPPPLLKT